MLPLGWKSWRCLDCMARQVVLFGEVEKGLLPGKELQNRGRKKKDDDDSMPILWIIKVQGKVRRYAWRSYR